MKFTSIFIIMSLSFTTTVNAQSVADPKGKIEKMHAFFTNYYSNSKSCNCDISKNTKILRDQISTLILDFNKSEYFPGYADVGRESSDHYLELLFESNNDAHIQKAMELMYPQVLSKNASAIQYATYIDKSTYAKIKLQVYGTLVKAENICPPPGEIKFTVMPIRDSENVEMRRAKIGLTTIPEMIENYRDRILRK